MTITRREAEYALLNGRVRSLKIGAYQRIKSLAELGDVALAHTGYSSLEVAVRVILAETEKEIKRAEEESEANLTKISK